MLNVWDFLVIHIVDLHDEQTVSELMIEMSIHINLLC